jgi:ABC-type molybdate transport system substrate-binding protein
MASREQLVDIVLKNAAKILEMAGTGLAVIANSGTSYALNLALGNFFKQTLNNNVTYSFSGSVSGDFCMWIVETIEDGTGSHTITWPTIKWHDAALPTKSTAAASRDLWVFWTWDGGTTLEGYQAAKGLA